MALNNNKSRHWCGLAHISGSGSLKYHANLAKSIDMSCISAHHGDIVPLSLAIL